jgi:hypothetical protein
MTGSQAPDSGKPIAECCEHEWQACVSWYADGSMDCWLECTECHEKQTDVALSLQEVMNAELVGELWQPRPVTPPTGSRAASAQPTG